MDFTISKPNFSTEDLSRIDPRILKFATGWKLVEWWGGIWQSPPDYTISNYFEATDKPEGRDQDEKQLTIRCGWSGRSNGHDIDGFYDEECEITISVNGPDASDLTKKTAINVEILKSGGTSMLLYWNDKLVTDFTSIGQVFALVGGKIQLVTARYPNGYQTRNMNDYV